MSPNNNEFESEFTFETGATPLPEEMPFHILMLGDWSGDLNRNELESRRPMVIDRDNFDNVLNRLQVGLEIDLHGDESNVLKLEFTELDDFHPDNIFRRVPLFSELRDVRRRLSNSDTFERAAGEVRSWFASADSSLTNDAEILSDIDDAPPIESTNLLDSILSQPVTSAASPKPQKVDNSELGRFVSKIVSPHLIRIDEAEQSKLILAVDETISELMRAILHHPKFQALESAWRGLYLLVRRLETDVDLKVFILDASKAELSDNLKSVNSLADSFLYRWLIREGVEATGGEPFSIIGGNYAFGLNVDDVATLLRISRLAQASDAPFLSYIQPELFGLKNFSANIGESGLKVQKESNEEKLWATLRGSDEANYLSLSPMRVIARMPYGAATDPTEAFSFEEFTDNDEARIDWMNSCFVNVLLFAQKFRLYGWELEPASGSSVENLPLYMFRKDGETKSTPCAEVVLTENILEILLEQGFTPLISYRDSDKIRVPRFQSISDSQRNLCGRWNS